MTIFCETKVQDVQIVGLQARDISLDNDFAELTHSPMILKPQDTNKSTPASMPSHSDKSRTSPRKERERNRGRVRERLDFGSDKTPRKSQDVSDRLEDHSTSSSSGGSCSSEDKENFAIPKSPS